MSAGTGGTWQVIDASLHDGDHVADLSNELLVISTAPLGDPLADARLIAAAPELLKALKSARILLTCVESCSRNNFTNLADEEVEAIDAAIAKATRGQP